MEILIAVISFVLGYLVEKIFDFILNKIKSVHHHKKAIANINNMKEHIAKELSDTLLIASGKPTFQMHHVDMVLEDKCMYLSFPDEKRPLLMDSSGHFEEQDTFFIQPSLEGVSKEAFSAALENVRQQVADSFVNRTDGMYFNGKKFGVLVSDGFSRTCDNTEQPILSYRLFLTDYFTEQVMAKTVKSLLPASYTFSLEELNSSLSFTRTSIGVSVIVVLKSSNQIIMTKRSKNSSFTNGKEWIYVSVTEGFSNTDFDDYINKPRLDFCVRRGLLEELNIDESMYSSKDMSVLDAFFETCFIQDGIVCVVKLNEQIEFNYILENAKKAKDLELEISHLFLINNDKKSIRDFVKENKENMRAQTIFSLDSYCARL